MGQTVDSDSVVGIMVVRKTWQFAFNTDFVAQSDLIIFLQFFFHSELIFHTLRRQRGTGKQMKQCVEYLLFSERNIS